MEETTLYNKRAVTALTLGILSIVTPALGLILGIFGVIYASKSQVEMEHTGEPGRGIAIAGKICGIIGIISNSALIISVFMYYGMTNVS